MKLIFCIDNKNGMMFFGKRQSQDSLLRKWIIEHSVDGKLWMSSYSAKQFNDHIGYIVDDNYMQNSTQQQNTSQTVYVTETGKKYHSRSSCSGLSRAKAIYTSTLQNAKNRGLGPCSKCY